MVAAELMRRAEATVRRLPRYGTCSRLPWKTRCGHAPKSSSHDYLACMEIEITTKKSEGGARHLEVRVPAQTVADAEDKAARRYASKVRLPGFRPGKAPAAIIRKRFGPAIREEALNSLLNDAYKEVLEREKIHPAGQPRVEHVHFDEGQPLTFELHVEVRPEIVLARTGGFRVYLGTIPNYADSSDGLLLDGIRDDSPAAKAGLKAGDRIVKIGNRDVKNVYDYTHALGEMKAGQEYVIEVVRGTERLTLKITPAARN